jgi:hypothetical protein
MPQEMTALLISTARYLIDLPVMRRDSKSYLTFEFRFYFYDSLGFINALFMMLTLENKVFTGQYMRGWVKSDRIVKEETIKAAFWGGSRRCLIGK